MPISWEAVAGGIVLIVGAVGKVLLDYQKGKREEKHADERLQTLKDIASSNKEIRNGQIEQNGKLATIMQVNGIRHDEMIRTLNSSCKAKDVFPTVGELKQEREKQNETMENPNRNRPPWHKSGSVHRPSGGEQSRRDGQH